jgi:hypothetical protein
MLWRQTLLEQQTKHNHVKSVIKRSKSCRKGPSRSIRSHNSVDILFILLSDVSCVMLFSPFYYDSGSKLLFTYWFIFHSPWRNACIMRGSYNLELVYHSPWQASVGGGSNSWVMTVMCLFWIMEMGCLGKSVWTKLWNLSKAQGNVLLDSKLPLADTGIYHDFLL